MDFTSAKRNEVVKPGSNLDELVRQISRLVRHPAYRRKTIVSALLLRQLPFDGGFGWRGEAALRERLVNAKLDAATVEHLIASVRNEILQLRFPEDV